ncbi:MAG: hypothetical protein QOJ81_1883 [Chloroflexota bacterium]|nr:hypothetical protein [Chloroflexota bacterium]
MPMLIGTSGWQYRHWRDTFYPRGVAQSRWLEFYAQRFDTVESNAAFYRLPERDTFANWAERTPDDFIWAVKVSRFLTHIKRLREPAEPVERFVSHARGLGGKLGPALLQLPPQLEMDAALLDQCLAEFPPDVRVAVEFRHKSWWTADIEEVLRLRGAALCWADRLRPISPLWRTADWGYLRFHQGRASPRPCYGEDALQSWVERIDGVLPHSAEMFVYFNNDHRACALRDATVFARLAQRAGWEVSRVPRLDEVRLA